jgi:hypothetical protein
MFHVVRTGQASGTRKVLQLAKALRISETQVTKLFQTRSPLPCRVVGAVVAILAIGVSIASACTIPVFRYALERWESDRFQVIVYHAGQLTAEQETAVKKLEERSWAANGPLNIEVIRYDVTAEAPKLLDVERPASDANLPLVEVRARSDQHGWLRRWQGPLATATQEPGVFESPARAEVVRRILAGDAAVWLLIAPNSEQGASLAKSLQESLNGVAKNLPQPEGIGLPGSELYASVPLELRFSVLMVSQTDPAEQRVLEMLATSARQWQADAAYVVPIFGRCRALDVIPQAELDDGTIDEVARFICSACSCQVKQANPGFDLLVSANWEERLFGATIPEFSDAATSPTDPRSNNQSLDAKTENEVAQYVEIPKGNVPANNVVAVDAQAPETSGTGNSHGPETVADRPASNLEADSPAPSIVPTNGLPSVLIAAGVLAILVIALVGFGRLK